MADCARDGCVTREARGGSAGKLKNQGVCGRIRSGSVAEWLKAHDSKSCGRASVSKVRILSLPPNGTNSRNLAIFLFSELVTTLMIAVEN